MASIGDDRDGRPTVLKVVESPPRAIMTQRLNRDVRLTARETEILTILFTEKIEQKQIAGRLGVTHPCVNIHIHNAMRKAGVKFFWELYPLFAPEDFKA